MEKIKVFGFPVSPKFADSARIELRATSTQLRAPCSIHDTRCHSRRPGTGRTASLNWVWISP